MKEYFALCKNGIQISPSFNTSKEASDWGIKRGYDTADDAISIESVWDEKWEVVKQDNGYFTLFLNQEQYCDEDGNPIRYKTYQEANTICEQLNDD